MKQQTDEEALRKFLLDTECLTRLESKLSCFNAFDVLNISRTEIRHSNVLAWLMDPHGSHGLTDRVMKKLAKYIAQSAWVRDDDSFKLLTMDFSDITIYREWHNIDILVVSKEKKFVLCIENKIDTNDHDEQLNRYYKIIEDKYPGSDWLKVYLYLSPDGRAPREDANDIWNCIDYEVLIDMIKVIKENTPIDSSVKAFIDNYIEIVRREIMDDEHIVELCQEIYKQHKTALDLIFENRPDQLQNVSELFRQWCKNNQNRVTLDKNKCSKSYTRFKTPFMNETIPQSEKDSGWGVKNHYFYEIIANIDKNGEIKYYMQLTFNSANLEPKNKEKLEKIDRIFHPNPNLKQGWQWRSVFKTSQETIKDSDDLPDTEDTDNEIYKKLDEMMNQVLDNEKRIRNELETI